MKIQEQQGKFGTLFTILGSIEEFNDISRWLKQNDIQYIHKFLRTSKTQYFIRDKSSIMAFKLRWI